MVPDAGMSLRQQQNTTHAKFQMALANKKLNTELDTVFLMTDQKYLFLSSTIVRDIARHGGDISELVSEEVREDILKKLDRTHQNNG